MTTAGKKGRVREERGTREKSGGGVVVRREDVWIGPPRVGRAGLQTVGRPWGVGAILGLSCAGLGRHAARWPSVRSGYSTMPVSCNSASA